MQSIKEHNLKANHNKRKVDKKGKVSVCNLSKNTIWKQITTAPPRVVVVRVLYAIYQRTQSESKSQLSNPACGLPLLCMQSIKEHNLKANHNGFAHRIFQLLSVCNLSKNTIWKQITTDQGFFLSMKNLYAIYQRTQSESKSQLIIASWIFSIVCMQSIKEHNLKANHNPNPNVRYRRWSVCNLSKNTIWKQITTGWFV